MFCRWNFIADEIVLLTTVTLLLDIINRSQKPSQILKMQEYNFPQKISAEVHQLGQISPYNFLNYQFLICLN